MSASQPGRVAVITGAARGIGAATASLLAGRGDRVVVADIDGELAETVAGTIGPQCRGYRLDVSDREGFNAFIDKVEEEVGPIEVMINNAGIAMAAPRVTAQETEVIERTIDVNLKGVIYGTLAAVEKMQTRGSGAVINVASLAGVLGVAGLAAYSASKFGVVGFTEAIRAEQVGSGISFTVVMPGPVETDMMVGTRSAPLVRLVKPEVLAEAIVGAIETGKPRVAVPRSTGVYVRLMSILPPTVALRMNRMIGMDRVYTEIDEAARNEYSERIKGSIDQ